MGCWWSPLSGPSCGTFFSSARGGNQLDQASKSHRMPGNTWLCKEMEVQTEFIAFYSMLIGICIYIYVYDSFDFGGAQSSDKATCWCLTIPSSRQGFLAVSFLFFRVGNSNCTHQRDTTWYWVLASSVFGVVTVRQSNMATDNPPLIDDFLMCHTVSNWFLIKTLFVVHFPLPWWHQRLPSGKLT